jgi:O-antigen/teichoic acid export membrane protein
MSASAVAYYSAPQEMITRLSIITMSLVTTLFPAFSHLHAKGDHERILLLVSNALKYIFLILGPILIIVVLFSKEILLLWVGENFAQNSERVLQLLAVGIFVNSIAYVPFYLLRAAGRPDLPAKIHLLELPVYMVLLPLLIKHYGIQGASIAWTARCAMDAILLSLAGNRVIGFTMPFFVGERVHIIFLLFIVSCGVSAVIGLLGTGFAMHLALLTVVIVGFYLVSWVWVIKRSLAGMKK